MNNLVGKLRNRIVASTHDLLMIPIAWMVSYWFRFNLGTIPAEMVGSSVEALWVLIPVQAIFFWYFGLYRGVWRFASMPDLLRIIKAVVFGVGLSMIVLFVFTRLEGVPRSVPILYSLVLFGLLSGPRLLYRWLKDYRFPFGNGKRVLIVGAGRAGEMLVRDLLRERNHNYHPVAFVDDDRRKWGREVHGVRVAGGCDGIPELSGKIAAEVIMLAVPSVNSRQMRRLIELCEKTDLPVRTLPSLQDLVSGHANLKELREVSIEDLLGREPVSLDWEAISSGLAGKKILVSGAGGSIGSELCAQIAKVGPAELILLENSEYNLYSVELMLRKKFPALKLIPRLGDVADAAMVNRLMGQYRPQAVFHAAAYKHVPMLEYQVREAARNNVYGTRVIAEAADRFGVDIFVLISTDKAVNPTNVMGSSKRVAEIFCQNFNERSSTTFVTVRFGNVLGSTGSVVPLFRKQIAEGGPVTVTHPEVTRYFMTIPEACRLIMQAAVMGRGGEIFVLDMGESVKINYLAEQMIRLSGKEPGHDIEIVYTGLRPGEKLFEELFHEKENLSQTEHKKILLAHPRKVEWAMLDNILEKMERACHEYDEAQLLTLIKTLVPELHKTEESAASKVVPINRNDHCA